MKFLIYLVLCLPFCLAIDCNKNNVTDDGFVCQSPNYPENYTAGVCECNFRVDSGYKIEVFIEDLNLDSSGQDNILIKGGPDDEQIQGSWFLNTTKKYLFENNQVSLKFDAKNDAVNYSGFSVHFRRYGGDLTTIAPSTEIPWPTPSNEDKIYHTILLKMYPKEFKSNESIFQNLMVNISTTYCQSVGFELLETITTRNIIIKSISNCLVDWPDSNNCVQVQYALPIILKNKIYELKRSSLEKMWGNYGKEAFANIDWATYDVPDTSTNFMWWIVLCCIILVVFGVLLYGMKVISPRMNFSGKRRKSDTMPITSSKKTSDISSMHSIHYQTPEFKVSMGDNSYIDFEPDYQQNARINKMRNWSDDDSSDDDILNVARIEDNNYSHNNVKGVVLDQAADISKESIL